MILCATNLSYQKLSFLSFLKKISKCGFKNIEIAPTLIFKNLYSKKNILILKKKLTENNINIISLQSLFFNTKKIDIKNKDDFYYLVNHFSKIIEIANKLKIKNLSLGSCPSRYFNIDRILLYKFNFKLLKKFSEIAFKKNIEINLEPVSFKYGSSFLNTPNEVLLFIKKIKKKNIKLLLDTGNCKSEKVNYKDFYLKNKKYIGHIQISDIDLNNLNINSLKKELKFFNDNNFNKTITIEYFSKNGKRIKALSKTIKPYI